MLGQGLLLVILFVLFIDVSMVVKKCSNNLLVFFKAIEEGALVVAVALLEAAVVHLKVVTGVAQIRKLVQFFCLFFLRFFCMVFLLIFIFITAHAAMLTLREGIPVTSAIHPGQKTLDTVEVGHQLSPFIKWSLVIQFFVLLRNVTVLNTFTQSKGCYILLTLIYY